MCSTALLIIDPQNDFHEGGSLAIDGALEDERRIAELINENGTKISNIFVTLDSHYPGHIAQPVYWKDSEGKPPSPFTTITLQDFKERRWVPSNPENERYMENYLQKLENGGKFRHIIWPVHCLVSTPGAEVVPVLKEALENWEKETLKQIRYVHKGLNNQTEMYSCFKAEVELPEDPRTGVNREVIFQLAAHDNILVCGQARSHCVNWSTRHLAENLPNQKLKSSIVILKDGMSSVKGFEAMGESFFVDMEAQGLKLMQVQEAKDWLAKMSAARNINARSKSCVIC